MGGLVYDLQVSTVGQPTLWMETGWYPYGWRMDNSHPGHGSDSDTSIWDDRHRERPTGAWSATPNGALLAETSGLAPGRAVDIGCGEGGDAI